MAVIVQYIVVRDGVQKMTFTTKKEADAYDKMLDIADNLFDFFKSEEFDIDEQKMEDISLYLAKNRDIIMPILKGAKPKPSEPKPEPDTKITGEKKPDSIKKAKAKSVKNVEKSPSKGKSKK